MEQLLALAFVNGLKEERSGKAVVSEVVDEGSVSTQHPFYAALTEEDVKDPEVSTNLNIEPSLYRVSDAGGKVAFNQVKSGSIAKSDFNANDVFVFETSKTCFVWIGKGSSPTEKQNGLGYAHTHLMKTPDPLRPIVVVKDGQENQEFRTALAA